MASSNNKYVKGTVSHVMNHQHSYYVDENGDGWTSLECHPDSKSVCHRHKIINYKVSNAKSPCHPFCKPRYGVDGVASHNHMIKTKSESPVKTFSRKSMSEVRRSANRTMKPLSKILNRGSMQLNSGNINTNTPKRPTKNRTVKSNGRVRNRTNMNRGSGNY